MTLKYLFPLTYHKTKLDFVISFSSKHQQQFFVAVPRTLYQYNITVVIKYSIYKISASVVAHSDDGSKITS